MILRLMRKDLLLNWNVVALVAAGMAIVVVLFSFGVGTERPGGIPLPVVVFLATCYASLLPTMFAARDDRYRTGPFDLALPVTRRQVVLSRYLFSLLALPVWIGLIAVTWWACRWPSFPSEAFSPGMLALALAAFILGMGVSFPLVVRLGHMGLLYGAVGLMVLGLAVVAAIRLVPPVRLHLQSIGQVASLLRDLHGRLGDPWYLAAVFSVLLCLYGISYAVTDALYRRKPL